MRFKLQVVLLFVSTFSIAQETSPTHDNLATASQGQARQSGVERDERAVALLTEVAMNSISVRILDSEVRGRQTLVSETYQEDIVFKTAGTATSIDRSGSKGMSSAFYSKDRGARLRKADGAVVEIPPLNAQIFRATHLPLLIVVEALENRSATVRISDDTWIEIDFNSVEKSMRPEPDYGVIRLRLDVTTHQVQALQYWWNSGQRPSRTSKIEVQYSDFKEFNGIVIAATQKTLVDGQSHSTLIIDSLQVNKGISASAIEVTK